MAEMVSITRDAAVAAYWALNKEVQQRRREFHHAQVEFYEGDREYEFARRALWDTMAWRQEVKVAAGIINTDL